MWLTSDKIPRSCSLQTANICVSCMFCPRCMHWEVPRKTQRNAWNSDQLETDWAALKGQAAAQGGKWSRVVLQWTGRPSVNYSTPQINRYLKQFYLTVTTSYTVCCQKTVPYNLRSHSHNLTCKKINFLMMTVNLISRTILAMFNNSIRFVCALSSFCSSQCRVSWSD